MSINKYANRETSASNVGGNPVPRQFNIVRSIDYRKQIINVTPIWRIRYKYTKRVEYIQCEIHCLEVPSII